MDFTLHALNDDGRFSQGFTGEASYEVGPSGALIVRDGRGKQFTYSPAAWFLVEEALPASTVPGRIR